MNKQQRFHHSITENGNLQLRIITEYKDDKGKVLDKKYSDPRTPANTKDMTGWDDRSKEIVTAITEKKVLANFEIEKNGIEIDGVLCKHPSKITGVGLEPTVSFDRIPDELCRIPVRRVMRIFDDGEEVSKKFHRSWIMPGDDTSKADVISRAVADKLHTQDVIDAYKAKMAELEAEAVPITK